MVTAPPTQGRPPIECGALVSPFVSGFFFGAGLDAFLPFLVLGCPTADGTVRPGLAVPWPTAWRRSLGGTCLAVPWLGPRLFPVLSRGERARADSVEAVLCREPSFALR